MTTGANEADGWPWSCTRCGRTVYDDRLTCRECGRTSRAAGAGGDRRDDWSLDGAVAWIRHQSYPAFLTRVSIIAGIELLLTTLWIRVLYQGAAVLPAALPG